MKIYLKIGIKLVIHHYNSFLELVTRTMPEPFILFDQEFYKQDDGAVMGSP